MISAAMCYQILAKKTFWDNFILNTNKSSYFLPLGVIWPLELAEEDEYRLETHPLCSEVMSLSDNDDEVRGSKQGGFNVTIAVVLFGGLSVVIVSRCCRTLSVVNESPPAPSSSLSTMVNSGIEQELEYCRIFSNSKSPCSFFDNADINDILRLGSFNFLDDTGSKEDDDELLEDSDEEVSLQIRLALLLLPIPLTILWRVASDDVINRRSIDMIMLLI